MNTNELILELREYLNNYTDNDDEYNLFLQMYNNFKQEYDSENLSKTNLICSKIFTIKYETLIFDKEVISLIINWGRNYKKIIKNSNQSIKAITSELITFQQLLRENLLNVKALSPNFINQEYKKYYLTHILNSSQFSSMAQAKKEHKEICDNDKPLINYKILKSEVFAENNKLNYDD